MRHFLLTRVHSSVGATEPNDLQKGLGFNVILESTTRLSGVEVPLFIKCKSRVDLDEGEQLLEVEVFNIGGTGGGKVQTYYRIIRKVDLSGVKEI